MQIISTDNGPHSAAAWATICAGQIIDHQNLQGDRLVAAQLLKARIADALEAHVAAAQAYEQAQLLADPKHLLTPLEADASASLAAVLKVTSESPWAAHFAKPDVMMVVNGIIHRCLITARNIERLWYADRNPAVQAFKE